MSEDWHHIPSRAEREDPQRVLDRIFGALADPTRRYVLARFMESDTLSVPELVEDSGMSRQAMAKHIQVLCDAGLIERAGRSGRHVKYQVTPLTLTRATNWLMEVDLAWEKRLTRLRHAAERGGDTGEDNG